METETVRAIVMCRRSGNRRARGNDRPGGDAKILFSILFPECRSSTGFMRTFAYVRGCSGVSGIAGTLNFSRGYR